MTIAPGPNEQALREAFADFNERLEDYLVDSDAPLHPLWAEDVEFVNFEPSPFPGTYRGHDGVRRWTREIFGDFTEAKLEILDVVEEGDRIAAHLKLSARGRSSGIPGVLEWGCLFTMREGLFVRAASDISYERTMERLRAG
jgi:ketosteroid isomerase-like protein